MVSLNFSSLGNNPVNWIDPKGLFRLHLGNATKKQIEAINKAINMLNKAASKKCSGAKPYFKKFNIDIATVLKPGQGPDVYIQTMSDYGYYHPVSNYIAITSGILGSPQAIASTLIHEAGHWANDVSGLNPDISDVPSFESPDPEDGPYGYAAEIMTFGFIYGADGESI